VTGTRKRERTFYPQLENLVESGLRPSCTPLEYSDKLRNLVQRVSEEEDFPSASEVFAGLANPARLMILRLLAERELCVCEVSFALRMTQPTTSHHLRILERAGLVDARPRGRWTFYRITNRRVLRLVENAGRLRPRPSVAVARQVPRARTR
jgi:ArsR family transcriptional regulator